MQKSLFLRHKSWLVEEEKESLQVVSRVVCIWQQSK